MQVQAQELRLLSELGTIAAQQRDLPGALEIFAAIGQERPQAPVAYSGPALAHLYAGQLAEAIRCLDEGVQRVRPEDQPALHALQGAIWLMTQRREDCERALALAGDLPLARSVRRELDALGPRPEVTS